MSQIHIVDGQNGVILGFIHEDKIVEDVHHRSKEENIETYSFEVLNGIYIDGLEKRNRIIIPDEDGRLAEFVLIEVVKDTYSTRALARASYFDLDRAEVVRPTILESSSVSQHAGRALVNTGWTVGTVESSGVRQIEIDSYTNPLTILEHIAKEFELELNFRVEHDGNKITGRYVDLLERVGQWRGREFEFGTDLDGIRRVEKQDIVTALLGLGPEDEDGNRLEVLVEDEDALKRWGRIDDYGNLHHLIEPYEIQSERTEMTEAEARRYTRTALNKRINTQITYEADVVDLADVLGMDHKEIRFGDTIRIKDTSFNPPLYLEARIFAQDRSIKRKAKKNLKLGDFIEYTEEEVNAIWLALQREIRKKIDVQMLRDYAEPKKVESDTPPEIKEGENPIWIDASKTPNVAHVVNGNEWVKMTPTTPEEVNAYNKQQVDEKAEQALEDAKAFSKNADNITEGVIDVGAIPLRTSITGARIEWDGVNGFVQYDRDGNPVNWFNLDGELYATKGHFSGDVTGATGTFGEVTVTDGDFKLKKDGLEYSATPRRNLIRDHSFELVRYDVDSINGDYMWADPIKGSIWYGDHWEFYGNPKLAIEFNPHNFRALPIYGKKAIVVRDAHFCRQELWEGVAAEQTYTISAFFKRQWNTSAGRPRFEIDYLKRDLFGNTERIRLINQIFDTLPSDYSEVRHSATFRIPSDFDFGRGDSVEIKFSGGDSNWVQVDGVQLVEGDIAAPYLDADETWEAIIGSYRPRTNPLWSGVYYPLGNHVIRPEKKLGDCANGWILMWQAYTPGGSTTSSDFMYSYIPKAHGSGSGVGILLRRGGIGIIGKYVYVHNDRIVGRDSNGNGDDRYMVLTGVYEW